MKDEELAEEWVRTKHNILKDCLSARVRAEHKNEIQAFLAGLKAGRPQWHDLRKDPNDLPEKSTTTNRLSKCVIGLVEVEIVRKQYISKECRYYFVEKKWKDYTDPYAINVIAWCEIPTFDKETRG